MKRFMKAILTVCMIALLLSPINQIQIVSANQAQQEGLSPDIKLSATPHIMGDWVVDGTYASNAPTAITKGKNEYMAVGYYGTVMKSIDGKTWTNLTRFNNYQLTAITWFGDSYILAGTDTEYEDAAISTPADLFISQDGLNWNKVEFSFNDSIQYLNVSDNMIIASGRTGIYASQDGQAWDKVYSFPADTYHYHPTQYVNGTFYINVYESNELLTSKDGVKWTKHKLDTKALVESMVYYNRQYIGIGYGEGIYKSSDGVKWTKISGAPDKVRFGSISTSGKKLVVMGTGKSQSDLHVYTSDNLTAWKSKDLSSLGHSSYQIYAVADGFAGIGFNQNSSIFSMFSKDGLNWSQQLVGASSFTDFEAIATNGKRVVAVAGQGIILYSDNGTKWNSVTLPAQKDLYGPPFLSDIVYGDNKFVVAGNDGVYYSKDGVKWTRSTSFKSPAPLLMNLEWTGTYFIAAAQYDGVYYSKDGVTWSKVNVMKDNSLSSLTFDGKRIIAAFEVYSGESSTIQLMETTNGKQWNKLSTLKTQSLELGYNNGTYLAYDPYSPANMWVSNNAKTWTKVNVPEGMKHDSLPLIEVFDQHFVLFNSAQVYEYGQYLKQAKYYTSKNGQAWKEHDMPRVQEGEIFGTERVKDGIKAFEKYIFVGSQGYIMHTTDLQLSKPVNIYINGKELEQSTHAGRGYIENGSTYLPLRVLGDALGYEVIWNEATRDVTFKDSHQEAIFSEIKLKNGKSYVGVRAVSEKLGYMLDFDIDEHKADIYILKN